MTITFGTLSNVAEVNDLRESEVMVHVNEDGTATIWGFDSDGDIVVIADKAIITRLPDRYITE